jgi:hypothetical protein
MPLFTTLLFVFGFVAASGRADTVARIETLGNNTYAATREAGNTFMRDLDQLKAEAMADAQAYCAKLHKELKVVSTTAKKPKVMLTGFASAKVVFKALDANDPELTAPNVAPTADGGSSNPVAAPAARTPTDTLYNDLMKLDDLRKRGILTEEEFQAQKKKLLEK